MKKSVLKLERYRRTRLSAERGLSPGKSALLRVCLVFPNTYAAGMSNLATHILYSILNSRKDCVCERSFCEEPLTGYSLETGSRLETFHIIAFTVSFELDYPNVLKTLLAARIPLRNEDRNESHPLVIAGGPCIFSNPEPLAECIDLFAIGEGEEIINEIIEVFAETRARRVNRVSTLRTLSEVPGVYVPSHFAPVYSDDGKLAGMECTNHNNLPVSGRVVSNLDDYPAGSVIVTPETEFAGMFLIELGRGCRRGCRFCSACYTYLRRNRSLDSIRRQIIPAKALSDRVGLVTSDFADYPHRKQLISFLLNENLGFSVSSVRADAITDDLLTGMRASGQRTLTLAPEVAVDKLARFTGKKISPDMLLRAVDMGLKQHLINFRLYFMIGFPGEVDDDVEAILELASRVQSAMRQAAKALRKMGKLTISVNPFVPKPFTPLESAPFADLTLLSRRLKILREGLARLGNTRLLAESPRMARLQCIFARGDRRVGRLAEMIAEGRTATQAMRAFECDVERYVGAQTGDVGMRPWHTIEPPAVGMKRVRGEHLN